MKLCKIGIVFIYAALLAFSACTGTIDTGAKSPGNITMISPADGAEYVKVMPVFTWSCDNAVKYNWELSELEDFDPENASTVTRKGIPAKTFIYPDEFEYGTVYYWRITAFSANNEKKVSPTTRFTTTPDMGLSLTVSQKSYITTPYVEGTYNIPDGGTDIKVLICPNKDFSAQDTKEFLCNPNGTFSFPKSNLSSGVNYLKIRAKFSGETFESTAEVTAYGYESFRLDPCSEPGNGNVFTKISYSITNGMADDYYFTHSKELDGRLKISCNPMPQYTAYLALNFSLEGTGKELNEIKAIYFNVQTNFVLSNLLAKTRDDGENNFVDRQTGAIYPVDGVKEFFAEVALPNATGKNPRLSLCPSTSNIGIIWIGDIYLLF